MDHLNLIKWLNLNKIYYNRIDFHGYVLEPFHMKNEREVGVITDQGYTLNKRKDYEVNDAWLNSLESDIY